MMPVGHPCRRSMTSIDTSVGVLEPGGIEHGGLCVSGMVTTHGSTGAGGWWPGSSTRCGANDGRLGSFERSVKFARYCRGRDEGLP